MGNALRCGLLLVPQPVSPWLYFALLLPGPCLMSESGLSFDALSTGPPQEEVL